MKLSRLPLVTVLLATFALALPVFAQDATPEATAQLATQTFTAADGTASVSFPAEWMVTNNPNSDSIISLQLANNQAAMDKMLFNLDDVFKPGEVHIEVEVIELTTLANSMSTSTITTDSTPLEVLQALADQGMPDEFTFGDPGEITINDLPAVRMNLTADKRGEGQLLLTIYDKKWLVGIILFAAPGEGDKWDIIARDILGSVTFDAKAPATPQVTPESASTQTYTSQKGQFTVAYPSAFDFEDQSDGAEIGFTGGVFYSNETVKDKTFADDFLAGEAKIEFAMTTLANYVALFGSSPRIDSTTPPADVLAGVIKNSTVPNLTYGSIQELPIEYGTLAHVDISGKGSSEGHVYLIKRESDGNFMIFVIYAAPGELEEGEAAALSIAASLAVNTSQTPAVESTVEPLDLTQTAKTQNGLGSLLYPATWLNRQFGSASIYVSNTQAALDKSFGSAFESGQVNILYSMSTTDEYIKQALLPAASDATPLELLQLSVKSVGDTIQFSTPEATKVGDKLAARVDFKGSGFEGIGWLIEYQKGAVIAVQLLTAPDQVERWESVALSIAESVRSTD